MTKLHKNNNASKAIVQFDSSGVFVDEYKSARDAFRKTGISYKNISSVLNGRRNFAGGYMWAFKLVAEPYWI